MHFMTYAKHAYDVILESESKAGVILDIDTEAYVVHLWARYLNQPLINKEPMAIKLLTGMGLPKNQKRDILREVADECLIINGLELGKNSWPSSNYYVDMGQLAYSNVAYIERPPELFYEDLAHQFKVISKVIYASKDFTIVI
jgi:hypothetical protein